MAAPSFLLSLPPSVRSLIFSYLVGTEEDAPLLYSSGNSLSRTCRELNSAWRSFVSFDIPLRLVRFYRGVALHYVRTDPAVHYSLDCIPPALHFSDDECVAEISRCGVRPRRVDPLQTHIGIFTSPTGLWFASYKTQSPQSLIVAHGSRVIDSLSILIDFIGPAWQFPPFLLAEARQGSFQALPYILLEYLRVSQTDSIPRLSSSLGLNVHAVDFRARAAVAAFNVFYVMYLTFFSFLNVKRQDVVSRRRFFPPPIPSCVDVSSPWMFVVKNGFYADCPVVDSCISQQPLEYVEFLPFLVSAQLYVSGKARLLPGLASPKTPWLSNDAWLHSLLPNDWNFRRFYNLVNAEPHRALVARSLEAFGLPDLLFILRSTRLEITAMQQLEMAYDRTLATIFPREIDKHFIVEWSVDALQLTAKFGGRPYRCRLLGLLEQMGGWPPQAFETVERCAVCNRLLTNEASKSLLMGHTCTKTLLLMSQ